MSQPTDGSAAAGLTEEEFDRLADHLAGVLEHDDAADVEDLVAGDPRWSAAYAALTRADESVRAALADDARSAPAMPADIAARLDGVIAGLGPFSSTRHLSAVVTTPAAASLPVVLARRRRMFTSLAAAAAAVAVFGGIGFAINMFHSIPLAATGASDMGAGQGSEAGGAPLPQVAASAPLLFASGRNYTAETLGQPLLPTRPNPVGSTGQSVYGSPYPPGAKGLGELTSATEDQVARPLARLLDPTALRDCLAAIRVIVPGVATAVDYASFAGQPALVVLLRDGATLQAVAVGAECGRSGADQLGTATVR